MLLVWLASLKLAVTLIVSLALILAWATFMEADRGREYAQWYVYKAPWFIALLGVLTVNVLSATLVRIPWKLRQAGFLMTHAGLLVLLAGSIVTFWVGIEGQLSMMEAPRGQPALQAEPANTLLLTGQSVITASWWLKDGTPANLDFPFTPGAADWPDGKTRDLGELDGVGIRVLKFYRHARKAKNPSGQQPSFRPIELAAGETSGPEAAVLLEVNAWGTTEEIWLKRFDREHGLQTVSTAERPLSVSFGYAELPLDFSLKLLDFERGMNPGGMGNASFSSSVTLTDTKRGINEEEHLISMNQPLTHGKFTFYQSSYRELGGGREMSILSAAYDPGRFLKYLGSLMICVGTLVMICRRARFFGNNGSAKSKDQRAVARSKKRKKK